jgi:Tol biopolymer transport system component
MAIGSSIGGTVACLRAVIAASAICCAVALGPWVGTSRADGGDHITYVQRNGSDMLGWTERLMRANVDGSNPTPIPLAMKDCFAVCLVDSQAQSPDGRTVAVSANCDLYLTDTDGSYSDRVVNAARDVNGAPADCNERPHFSPDGGTVIYNHRNLANTDVVVDTITVDGLDQRTLLAWTPASNGFRAQVDAQYSPDGRKIVFSSATTPSGDTTCSFTVWTANSDGTDPVRLTDGGTLGPNGCTTTPESDAITPVYSPAGARIAFVTHTGLWTMNGDGTAQASAAPPGSTSTGHPTWSQSNRIAVEGGLDPNCATGYSCYLIAAQDPDGGNASTLISGGCENPYVGCANSFPSYTPASYASDFISPTGTTPQTVVDDDPQLDSQMWMTVGLSNGNLVVHNRDLQIGGSGLNAIFDRYYNSLQGTATDLGNGWSSNQGGDIRLDTTSDPQVVTYYGATGLVVHYTENPDGTYADPRALVRHSRRTATPVSRSVKTRAARHTNSPPRASCRGAPTPTATR